MWRCKKTQCYQTHEKKTRKTRGVGEGEADDKNKNVGEEGEGKEEVEPVRDEG